MTLLLPNNAELWNVTAKRYDTAEFSSITRSTAKRLIDGAWWTDDSGNLRQRTDGDSWSWVTIAGEARIERWSELIGLQTADGRIQGAVNYWTNGKSLLEHDKGSIFLAHLATAPWNRDWMSDPPVYRGAGTALVLYAVCHSYILGLEGRLTVVALPTGNNEQFYLNRGFAEVARLDDGKIEYEMQSSTAKSWLKDEGLLT